MKKVLILGAGMVVKPIAHYLLDYDIEVTLASRTKAKADKVVEGYANANTVAWTIDQSDVLDTLIADHDLTVSLLPYTYHVAIADKCIAQGKNMLTTSYVSPEMRALDSNAKEAGIIILNEIGVDPGYDHMTAMRIIDRVHENGGKINEFFSLCGALCAPEASDNPFRYKFSWSPKGVVLASNNDAKFLKNDKVVHLDTSDLFKNPLVIDFPEVESMHAYPNRDSLPYIAIYGIPEAKTVYRGTFRYKNWCKALDLMKALNWTGYDEINLTGKTYSQMTAMLSGLPEKGIKEAVKTKFKIDDGHAGLIALEWLGIFDDTLIPMEKGSAFDLVSDLMIEKMMMNDSERDMVIMQHIFNITDANGESKTITAKMVDFGNTDYTSIARTVALPAAIGVKMILDGEITDTGVHIPIKKSIYDPILSALEKLGIRMKETTLKGELPFAE